LLWNLGYNWVLDDTKGWLPARELALVTGLAHRTIGVIAGRYEDIIVAKCRHHPNHVCRDHKDKAHDCAHNCVSLREYKLIVPARLDKLILPGDRTPPGLIVARAQNVKNGRSHKLVLEGELAEIIEQCWAARVYQTSSGPAMSQYVFHRDGKQVKEFRKSWARKIGVLSRR
jgi:hypothetical protein